VELGHRRRLHERLAFVGLNGELAVGLALARGELGQELVVGHPGRRIEACLFLDPGPDRLGGLPGCLHPGLVGYDVEIGLVERQRLDQVGELREDRVDLLRDRPIDVEPGRHKDQVRTLAQRSQRWQGRPDTEGAGLVGGCRDHATGLPCSEGLSRCSTDA
jgi:hypothetical protein